VFQQVPLNIIESNTELISYYRKKREAEVYAGNIPGISSNSIDAVESLTPAAQLALASVSADVISSQFAASFPTLNNKNTNQMPKADSYFKELVEHLTQEQQTLRRVKRYSYEPTDRINEIFGQYERLASDYGRKNCHLFSDDERRLPGDTIYGIGTQFESQAKLALSISHFLSSFYQIINPEEDFPLRNAEKSISEDQMYAEVISTIAADFRVRNFNSKLQKIH
jgi:hypothetical protein